MLRRDPSQRPRCTSESASTSRRVSGDKLSSDSRHTTCTPCVHSKSLHERDGPVCDNGPGAFPQEGVTMSATAAVKGNVVELPAQGPRPVRKAPARTALRIAQVAPLSESVPPKLYGGTERVVATLSDELVRQGHEVTLFASGDSQTTAELVAPCSRALRLSAAPDPLAVHLYMIEKVA